MDFSSTLAERMALVGKTGVYSGMSEQNTLVRRRAWGMVCTLLLTLLGCTESQHAKPEVPSAPTKVTVTDAGPPPSISPTQDAGGVTHSASVSDAGIAPTGVPPNSQAGTLVRPLERVPSLKLKLVASQEALIRAHAQQAGWDISAESLKSYWHPTSQVENAGLGRFTLGYLSNPAQPRGGEQTWILLREQGGKLAVYGPLITQVPWTPDYMQKVTAKQMLLRPIEGSLEKLLWLQLQDKLTTPLDPEGEQLESKVRLLDYGFLVDGNGRFKPVAFQLPERLARELDDELQAETSLVVEFPSADRMVVKAGPEGASPEQQSWIGEHPLER